MKTLLILVHFSFGVNSEFLEHMHHSKQKRNTHTVIPTDIFDRPEHYLFYWSQRTQTILIPPHLTFIIWNGDSEGFG